MLSTYRYHFSYYRCQILYYSLRRFAIHIPTSCNMGPKTYAPRDTLMTLPSCLMAKWLLAFRCLLHLPFWPTSCFWCRMMFVSLACPQAVHKLMFDLVVACHTLCLYGLLYFFCISFILYIPRAPFFTVFRCPLTVIYCIYSWFQIFDAFLRCTHGSYPILLLSPIGSLRV